MICDVSTPNRRSSAMQASEIGLFGGRTVMYLVCRPNVDTATATFASPPPKVATNWGDCRKRSKPGGARRSMISPKVTTVLDMEAKFYQGRTIVPWTDSTVLEGGISYRA